MTPEKPLSSRQCIYNLINRLPIDRIPKGELVIDPDVLMAAGYAQSGFDETLEMIHYLGLDLVVISPKYPTNPHRLPTPADYHWPDLNRWVQQTPLFTFAILDGAFEWGLRLFGLEDFLPKIVRSSDFVHEFIHQVETYNIKLFENLVTEGIDGIILADDIASSASVLVRPTTLRNTFLPSLARQAEMIQSKNIPVFFHSDGNYSLVIEDIVNAGFDGLHCLDKNAGMEINKIQEQFGDRICLWGHLVANDVTQSVHTSFRAELVDQIHQLSVQGRIILGTTSGLFTGIDTSLLKQIYSAV